MTLFERFRVKSPLSWRSIVISLLVSLVTTALLFGLFLTDFFSTYELKSLDFFQRFNAPLEDPEVLIVEIDQTSLTTLSEQGIQWPWPRQIYAPLIEVCAQAGARAIMFDLIFSEPSSYGREDDLALVRGIESAQNVFLPISMIRHGDYKTDIRPIKRFGVRDELPGLLFEEARSYVPPIEELAMAVKGLGNVIVSPDRDGVFRRVSVFTRYQGYLVPSLAGASLRNRFAFEGREILFDEKPLPLGGRGELLLHYYGKEFRFPALNVLDIVSAYQNREGPLFEILASRVRDRFIIIALTAPGLRDLKPTAVTSRSPGVYVHATLLANLIHGNHIRQIVNGWRFLLVFLLGSALGLLVITVLSFWKNSFIFLSFLLGWSLFSLGLFYHYEYWIGFLPFEIAFFIVFGLTATYSHATEGKKRRRIKHLFSHYMSEVLVRELESNPHKARLGGDKRFITIFFSDLANFTRLCEQFEPEKIVGLLNEYFTEMSQIILDSKGIIDKYQGDGIMAFWGAPILLEEHAIMACFAALRCQESMQQINEKMKNQGFPSLSMRIGLHSGEAIVGNMGSTRRFDYTAIGDNVNVASRLEGLNRQFGTAIILSEATYERAKAWVSARELDLIAIKGKEKPIRIFQLLGEKDRIRSDDEEVKNLFENGLRLYRMRRFEEAQRTFEKVIGLRPDDHPAQIFIARCKHLVHTQPATDWDGVFRLNTDELQTD